MSNTNTFTSQPYLQMDYIDDEYMNDISHQFFYRDVRNSTIGPLNTSDGGNTRYADPEILLEPYASKFPPTANEYSTSRFSRYDSFEDETHHSTHESDLITENQTQCNLDIHSTLETEADHSQHGVLCNNMDKNRTRRNSAKIFGKKEIHLPEGFPSGPWVSFEEAKNEVQNWAFDFNFGGGRFKLILGSFKKANSARGDQRRLICSRSKENKAKADLRRTFSDKCNCPYHIIIEDCIEGWIIFNGHFFHNHELIQTTGSSLSQSALRFIPDQLIDIGEICKRAGYAPTLINRVLQSEAFHQNIEITWNYNDIYNHFKPSSREKGFDATNFVEYLHQRNLDKSLFYATVTDTDGCLIRAFWISEKGTQTWTQGGDQNPILFGTSHATNRYGLRFADIDTVDKHGRTVILACALIFDETEDSFIWIFEQFLKSFYIAPSTIVTDGDPAIASALKKIFPLTNHSLCTWHISQNIFSHLKPLLGSHFNQFIKKWWAICKRQDLHSIESFDREWDELLGIVNNSNLNGQSIPWLQSLYDKRRKWAVRWTWQFHTRGIISTQRSESVHFAIKGFLTAHTLLTELVAKLDQYQITISEKGEGNATRLALKQASQNTPTHPIQKYFSTISPFARSLIEVQISKCLNYDIIAEEEGDILGKIYTIKCNMNHSLNRPIMGNEKDLWRDSQNETSITTTVLRNDLGIEDAFNQEKIRKTSLTTCTCLFPSSYGLPCRHMLWIYRQKQMEFTPTSVISPIWHILASSCTEVSHQVMNDNYDSTVQECGVPILNADENYLLMCSEFKSIAEKAKNSEENIKIVRDSIKMLAANLQYMNLNERYFAKENQQLSSPREKNESSRKIVLNPKTAKKVGRPKRKRVVNPMLSKKRNNRKRKRQEQ